MRPLAYIRAFPCLRLARLRSRSLRPDALTWVRASPSLENFPESVWTLPNDFLPPRPPCALSRHCISRIAFIKRSQSPVSFDPLFYGYRDYANARTAVVAIGTELRVLSTPIAQSSTIRSRIADRSRPLDANSIPPAGQCDSIFRLDSKNGGLRQVL